MWKRRKKLDIEDQLYLFQIFGIIVTAALCLVLTIFVTIGRSNSQQTDRLFRESTAIAKAAPVVEALEHNGDTEYDVIFATIWISILSRSPIWTLLRYVKKTAPAATIPTGRLSAGS